MERFIEIDGQKIPVTEEVYQVYMRPEWKEKKRIQRMEETPLSIERMLEDGVDIPYFGPTVEQIVMLKMLLEELHSALEQLVPDERALMEMVGSGASVREISRETGIPRNTVAYRKERLLSKLRDKILKNL